MYRCVPGAECKNLDKLEMVRGFQDILQVTVIDDNCSCVCILNQCSQTNRCHSLQLHLCQSINRWSVHRCFIEICVEGCYKTVQPLVTRSYKILVLRH